MTWVNHFFLLSLLKVRKREKALWSSSQIKQQVSICQATLSQEKIFHFQSSFSGALALSPCEKVSHSPMFLIYRKHIYREVKQKHTEIQIKLTTSILFSARWSTLPFPQKIMGKSEVKVKHSFCASWSQKCSFVIVGDRLNGAQL